LANISFALGLFWDAFARLILPLFIPEGFNPAPMLHVMTENVIQKLDDCIT